MTVKQMREQLRAIRLQSGWSYEDLAADIRRVNNDDRVSAATARRLLAENHEPSELIAYALETYLDRRTAA